MNIAQLPAGANNDKNAIEQRDKINTEIATIRGELTGIDLEAQAITNEAINSAKTDDAKALIKRIDAVRVRRLAVAIRELRLIGFEGDLNRAVKDASRLDVARLQKELEAREIELNNCADSLGYASDAVQRTTLIRTDAKRTQLNGAIRDASHTANNWRYRASDEAREMELTQTIMNVLKI